MTRPITKSDYLAGMQCPLHLWNRQRAPIPHDERVETSTIRSGTGVGLLAHQLFPGGVLIDSEPWEREESVARTRDLIKNKDVPAIFEAGFLLDGLHARADILKRKPSGTFALYEVKSTGSVKDQHIPDLAFQVHIARSADLEIDEAGIIHINKEYERGSELDVHRLFMISNETATMEEYLEGIAANIALQKNILIGSAPVQEPGRHCHVPYKCEFWERCTERKPKDWIFHLPRLSEQRYGELRARGTDSIREIPDDYELSEIQGRIRDVLRIGKPYFGPGLADALAEVSPSLSYLDFETISPAVPLWRRTRPFQRIPFQWSLHRRAETGSLTHAEFLADERSDPRRAFAESLVEELGKSKERIAVYNQGFEGSVLRELASQHRDLAAKLRNIKDRLWDLLPIVRKHVYLKEFGGSFSIKSVAPALSSEINYSALDGVSDGTAASDAFERLVTRKFTDNETEHSIRASLLRYCHLDTFAMVKLHDVLRSS